MLMTPVAERLISALRNDQYVRGHFNISRWTGHRYLCGTTGCIAGWAVTFDQGFKTVDDFTDETSLLEGRDEYEFFVNQGARALGLGDRVANELFLPVEYMSHLHISREVYFHPLSDNERPDADSAEAMIAHAEWYMGDDHDFSPRIYFGPDICATALENVITKERQYVNWAEASGETWP